MCCATGTAQNLTDSEKGNIAVNQWDDDGDVQKQKQVFFFFFLSYQNQTNNNLKNHATVASISEFGLGFFFLLSYSFFLLLNLS